jgi:hypothetical protein
VWYGTLTQLHNFGSGELCAVCEYEQDRAKLKVLCILSCHKVVGPPFFQEQTVNSVNYLNMLQFLADCTPSAKHFLSAGWYSSSLGPDKKTVSG